MSPRQDSNLRPSGYEQRVPAKSRSVRRVVTNCPGVYSQSVRLLRQLFHYRDKQQREVDVVMERHSGEVVGVEVKASATPAER